MIPDPDQYDPDEIADGFRVFDPNWDPDDPESGYDPDEHLYRDVTDDTF